MANKMTKRDYFAILRETFPIDHPKYAETIAFIDHEVELLNRKNSSEKKPTKVQMENESIKDAIFEQMESNHLYTISDMIKEIPVCDGLAGQKVSALVRQMIPLRIERIEEKRKAYFRKVEKEEEGD